MHELELFLIFTEPLERLSIRYMVSGAVAAIIYGEPRVTHDIDIVVELKAQHISELNNAYPLDHFYCPPEEVITIESRRSHRGHFNIIHHDTGYKADIYLIGADKLQAWGMARRQRIPIDDEKGIWVAPAEYVILRKLEYFKEGGSEKHIRDIRGMQSLSADKINTANIVEWARRLDLENEWKLAQQRAETEDQGH